MPRKRKRQYDKDGKMYAWSDDGFAVRKQVQDAISSFPWAAENEEQAYAIQSLVSFEHWGDVQNGECSDIGLYEANEASLNDSNEGHEYRRDYRKDNLHGVVNKDVLTANPSFKFQSYLNPANIPDGEAALDTIRDAWIKKAGTIPAGEKYERIRRYCMTEALYADREAGDYSQAMANSPYLAELKGLVANLPSFMTMDMDAVINGMGQDAFDKYMDFVNAGADELRAEYTRQTMADMKGGWDADKEKIYLDELKAAHQQTVSAFDNLWNMENPQQYDQFLESKSWDQILGKLPETAKDARPVTQQVGMIRGELQAIENGWGSKDLQILGILGGIEARLQRERLAFPNDQKKKQQADAIEQDFQSLKASAWKRKIWGPENKAAIVKNVRNFLDKHKDNEYVKEIYGNSKETFDAAMANVDAELKAYQTQQKGIEDSTFQQFQTMEAAGNWRGIAEKMAAISEHTNAGIPNAGEQDGCMRYQESLIAKDEKGAFLPEKIRAIKEISKELGRMKAENSHANPNPEIVDDHGTAISAALNDLGHLRPKGITVTVQGASLIGSSERDAELFSQNADAEEMQKREQELNEKNAGLSEYMGGIAQVAATAKDALSRLDSKSKWWASDNQEYKEMRSALEALSKLDGRRSPEQVNSLLMNLGDKASIYEETHDVPGRGRSALGQHRLNMSRELKEMASAQKAYLGGKISIHLHGYTALNDQIEASRLALAAIQKAKEERKIQYPAGKKQGAGKVEKIDFKTLQQRGKGDNAPEQKDLNPIQDEPKILPGSKKDVPKNQEQKSRTMQGKH